MRSIAAIMLIAATQAALAPPAEDDWAFSSEAAIEAANYDDNADIIRENVIRDERDSAYDHDGEGDFIVNDDEITQAELDPTGWFNAVTGMPFFEANRARVWAEATEDLDQLLDVCPPGVECRNESRQRLIAKLTE